MAVASATGQGLPELLRAITVTLAQLEPDAGAVADGGAAAGGAVDGG